MMEIPKELQHLPVYHGFPVPHIVLFDGAGVPHFKVNDTPKLHECIRKKICHVCGNKLGDDMWMIGGQLSAFHPKGAFNDSPVHKVCGVFALQVCPYMAYSQYKATGSISNKLKDQGILFVNPTQMDEPLSFFVFIKVKDYTVKWRGVLHFITPRKPYLEVEYWLDGKQITQDNVNRILKEKKEHNHTLKYAGVKRGF